MTVQSRPVTGKADATVARSEQSAPPSRLQSRQALGKERTDAVSAKERSNQIVAVFQRLQKTGDRSQLGDVSEVDVEAALQDYSLDSQQPFYRAMEDHLRAVHRESDRKADLSRRRKDLIQGGVIGFAVGVLSIVVAEILLIKLGAR